MTSEMGRIVQSRLDPETLDLLTRLRRRTGLSDSELLRRGLHRLAENSPRARRHRIVGVGKFASKVTDLGSSKRHLRGFGRS
jgi:ribbon-helix-helix CopG family protein